MHPVPRVHSHDGAQNFQITYLDIKNKSEEIVADFFIFCNFLEFFVISYKKSPKLRATLTTQGEFFPPLVVGK